MSDEQQAGPLQWTDEDIDKEFDKRVWKSRYANGSEAQQICYEIRDDLRRQLAKVTEDLQVSETKFGQAGVIIADLTKRQGELTNLITMKDARILELALENTALTKQLAECEQRLAEASEWQPLPDGEVGPFTYVDNGGKLLGVFAGDDYSDWYATDDLPDDIRLCQRTPGKDTDHAE